MLLWAAALVFPVEEVADPNSQRGYRRVGAVGVRLLSRCSEGGFVRVFATE